MQEKGMISAGMAEVSVREIVALEKIASEKDQTIGALREQVRTIQQQAREEKSRIEKDFEQKVKEVRVVKVGTQKSSGRCPNCGYYYNGVECPDCGWYREMSQGNESLQYKNLDDVVDMIRKEESKKLGISVANLESKLNEKELELTKVKNDLEFKLSSVREDLQKTNKEHDKEISEAKEKIRKHMSGIIEGLNKEIEELNEEIKKVKKDKTDEAVEEARKQEIITLKERITELENASNEPIKLGWFKTIIYNWLDVDGKAKVAAEKERLEKQERIDKISNNYPSSKSFWIPSWMANWASTSTFSLRW